MARWSISIDDFLGGYAPAWYAEDYPFYGNKNQAGKMQNIDISSPGFLTQGPGLVNLTNGTEAGAVTDLVDSIIDTAVSNNVTYGIGGRYLQQISGSTVTNSGSFPYSITAASGTALGEDIALFQSNVYYTYNYTGAGDIGKYNLVSTFDDNWGSTVPSGKATLTVGVPHPIEVGGNDTMYIGNGRYVASWDGTTLIPQTLDLPAGTVISDLKWVSDYLWIATNASSLVGTNRNKSSIYIWNGTETSWNTEVVMPGRISTMYQKNGTIFVFYQDVSNTGGYKLAYVDGTNVVDLANYTGSLPTFSQVTEHKDFIIWNSDGKIYAFGSGDKDLPVRFFQYADGGYATVGAVANPLGTPLVSSVSGTAYRLAEFSGYDTNCNWKSLMFDLTGYGRQAQIDGVRINFATLSPSARADWKLLDAQGRTIYSDQISYTKATAGNHSHTLTTAYYPLNAKVSESFRLEFDFLNGSTTNPVKLRNARIYGTVD